MKKLILTITSVMCFALVASAQSYDSFGKKVKKNNAKPVSELITLDASESKNVKVEGVVESVCQVKGCWMTVKLDNGESMRVTFKDYGFFVPKDISGKKIIFEGEASVKTTPVDELQHYAKDAGKSAEEVAKIKDPKKELTFVADGVLVPSK
ncbi:protein of unknown function [Spirosomataceae bacterium TFI 002]|nr:protein of unknown function [Spirosomataceae bacterium TFI 002]